MSALPVKRALVAVTLLFTMFSQAREPEPDVGGFKSYETAAFTIVTHDASSARPIPRLAAQIDGVLATLLNRTAPLPSSPTYVALVPVSVWIRYVRPGQGISSDFVPTKFANYLIFDNSQGMSRLGAGFFHEYSHWFLHTQGGGYQPLWFDEGLAELVSTAEFRSSTVSLGHAGDSGRPLGWIPLERLLRLDKSSPEYLNDISTGVVHRQSWGIVHRGLVTDPKFGAQMFAFLEAINAQQPLEAAVQSSFGVSSSQLDRTLYSYLTQGDRFILPSSYKTLLLRVSPVTAQSLPPGRAMSELESLNFIAEFMLASGFNAAQLPEVANAIQRVAPNTASAVALYLRIAARNGDDARLEELLANIQPKISNPVLLRAAGLALYERAGVSKRTEQSARALELLDRAVMSRPDDVEAVYAYSILAAQLKRDLPVALRRTLGARALLPANPYLAQATVLIHEARGDIGLMKQALQDTLRLSKEPEMLRWAKTRLDVNAAP